MTHRTPRTTEQAQAMLERYSQLDGQLGHIESIRSTLIRKANVNADASAEALLAEQEEIRAKLAPWWQKNSAELTKGSRKSIELGGCMIGSRAGRDSLGTAADLDPVIASMQRRDWCKPLLRVTVSLDKAAVLKSIDGVYKKQLAELGFARVVGEDSFFVKAAAQGGTLTEIAA